MIKYILKISLILLFSCISNSFGDEYKMIYNVSTKKLDYVNVTVTSAAYATRAGNSVDTSAIGISTASLRTDVNAIILSTGVHRIIAGTNITLSPTGGQGDVTITAAGGGDMSKSVEGVAIGLSTASIMSSINNFISIADYPVVPSTSTSATQFSTSTLVLTLSANTTYMFEFYGVFYTTITTCGIFTTLYADVAPRKMNYSCIQALTAATMIYTAGITNYGGATATTGLASENNPVDIRGLIITGATETKLKLMFRAEVAGGVVSYRRGVARALKIGG